jgi:glycosyltransferase involved in cell wall biosynthesis
VSYTLRLHTCPLINGCFTGSAVVWPGPDTRPIYLTQFDEPYRLVDAVHVHSVGPFAKAELRLNLGRRWRRFRRALTEARRLKADLYHLHDPELIPLGLLLKATTRARVIFDCHENNTAYLRQKFHLPPVLRSSLTVAMGVFERLAARTFDAVVTADQGVAQLYRDRFGARRVQTIHNFPDLDLFLSQPLDAGANRPYDLVYHGTIPRYHLDVAFVVAEELRRRGRQTRWLFFGKCPQSDWAQAEARRRGLDADFTIDPNLVPHEQVAGRVIQAGSVLFPCRICRSFNIIFRPSSSNLWRWGCPQFSAICRRAGRFVGDGACALMVPPADYAAYADAIIACLMILRCGAPWAARAAGV